MLQHLFAATAVFVSAFGLWASVAQASGGATIEEAKELVTGHTVQSGWTHHVIDGTNGGEFWKISMKGGETLSIDTTNAVFSNDCGDFDLDFYEPGTTDANLTSAVVAVARGGGAQSFTAPFTGTWILFVNEGGCSNASVSYEYEASLTAGPPSAVAGAKTIEEAPELVLGQANASGWVNQPVDGTNGGEFWKISMKGGETLSIDTTDGQFSNDCGAFNVDFFSPGTTDANLPSAVIAVSRGGGATSFTAPYTGEWRMLVTEDGCDNTTVSYNYDAALTAGPASAVTGAATIAAAPELVLGQVDASGWVNQPVDGTNGGEFWKVSMTAGETLAIETTDGQFSNDCGSFNLDFYAPGVTDANLPAATPAATFGGGPASFKAPSSGLWTVFVTEGGCDDTTVSYDYDAAKSGGVSGGGAGGSGSTPSGGSSAGALAHVALARQTDTVSSRGVLSVQIACSGAPCSGGLRLTTTVAHKTVTIGTASFSGLGVGAHKLAVKLTPKGLRYLRQHHGRLGVTISVSYASGTHGASARTEATLASARGHGVPLA